MNEIISIIPNLKKRKLFSNEAYTLIVFKNETIFAKLTSKILNENIQKAKDKAKSEGKGFFSQWGAQIGASLNYETRYQKMSYDDILNENQANLVFKNDSISKIKIRRFDSSETTKTYYHIDIIVSGEKYKFRSNSNPANLFKLAFKDKVK